MTNRRRRFQMLGTGDDLNTAPKLQHETEQPLRSPTFAADVLGVGLISATFAGLAGWAFTGDWLLGVGIGSVVGAIVTVIRAFIVLDRPVADWERIVYQDVMIEPDEPPDDDRLFVIIPNPNGAPVEFVQPIPGEFANWASAVIRDLNDPDLAEYDRTSFSQNTAVRRGWSISDYKNMFAALELVGWVKRRRNQSPILTVRGEQSLAPWVRNQQPPAPIINTG